MTYSRKILYFPCSGHGFSLFYKESYFLSVQNGIQKRRSRYQVCSLLLLQHYFQAVKVDRATEGETRTHTLTHTHFIFHLKNHKFMPLPQILIQQSGFILAFPFLMSKTPFSNSEIFDSHHPQYYYSFAQARINRRLSQNLPMPLYKKPDRLEFNIFIVFGEVKITFSEMHKS